MIRFHAGFRVPASLLNRSSHLAIIPAAVCWAGREWFLKTFCPDLIKENQVIAAALPSSFFAQFRGDSFLWSNSKWKGSDEGWLLKLVNAGAIIDNLSVTSAAAAASPAASAPHPPAAVLPPLPPLLHRSSSSAHSAAAAKVAGPTPVGNQSFNAGLPLPSVCQCL